MNERDVSHSSTTQAEDPLLEAEASPLVDRLRQLEWPPVEPSLRERSWERFKRLMAEQDEES